MAMRSKTQVLLLSLNFNVFVDIAPMIPTVGGQHHPTMPTGDDCRFPVPSLGGDDPREVSLHCQKPATFPVMRCQEEQEDPDVEVGPTFQLVKLITSAKGLRRSCPVPLRLLEITAQGSGFCQCLLGGLQRLVRCQKISPNPVLDV